MYMKTFDTEIYSLKFTIFHCFSRVILYFSQDVVVMWELISKFRCIFMETFETEIDPFVHANGLPSLCALLYRTEFMEEATIQLIGDNNCLLKVQDSRLEQKYLWYLRSIGENLG